MELPAALDHIRDPRLRALVAYWLGRRGGRAVPARRDMDPVEFPWALPFAWICEYAPAAGDFRYRLAGEAINETHGQNLRRRLLREVIQPGVYPVVAARYRRVVEGPAIGHVLGAVYLNIDRPVPGERILLPLSGEHGAIDTILGVTLHDPGEVHPYHLSPNKALELAFTPVAAL